MPGLMDHTTRPKLKAPLGACDTHMHIYGPPDQYPFVPGPAMKPPPTPIPDYLAMLKRIGVERVVVVQPAGYGTDNRCTVDAVKTIGLHRARGIATVDTTVTDAELKRLTDAGMRGVRFFMLPGGVLPWEILEEMSRRVAPFGWHVQLQLDGRELPRHMPVLRKLASPLVVDHTGKFLEPVGTDHPGFKALQELVDGGRCWVKLSAPYETSKAGPPLYPDVGALGKVLARQAPERMLWASNWPHPGAPANDKPDDALMLDMILDWVPDKTTQQKMLVDNPAELYGF